MTPLERVRSTRRMLAGLTVTTAVLWGVAAGLAAYAVVVLVVGRGVWALAAGAVIGVATLSVRLWRGRAVWSLERTALWVETRAPALEYALVTAIEPQAADVVAQLTPRVERVAIGPLLRRSGVRVIGWAAAGLCVALVLVAALPARPIGMWRRQGSSAQPSAEVERNRLVPLTAQVTPPAYAHEATRELREPTTISALVGSTIVLTGRGDGAGIHGTAGGDSLMVATHGVGTSDAGWGMRLVMPAKAVAIRLTDRGFTRVVGLDPVIDNPPTVTLARPARDSTMRTAVGTLELEADATDDIGLTDGYFELIISAGEEEGSFTSTEKRVSGGGVGGGGGSGNVRHVALRARLDLAALKLKPGGLLSIRAVAHDGNTVSGPGVGTSETRTLRLAKPQEYDSVAVEGAPPATLDSTYLTQRLIIIRTEALVRAAKHLTRDSVVHAAQTLADKEEQLNLKIYTSLHGVESPESKTDAQVLPESQRALFDTAYQALQDATNDLSVAEVKAAVAPEYVALHALDKARIAKRLYLRGTPPTIVVNINRVRLSGTEKADAAARLPGAPRDTAAAVLSRLEQAAVLASRAPAAAADSLTLLRAEAVATWPAAGPALEDAVTALRAGRDASAALARARRAVVGPPRVGAGLGQWNGGAE